MRAFFFDLAMAFAFIGVIGSVLFGGTVVWCTINLTPIAPGLLTAMIRSMMLASVGLFAMVWMARFQLSRSYP